MVFSRFDRWGNVIGTLHVISAEYQVSTAGIDQLTVMTFEDIDKGDRIVWKDADTGEYHEHEVSETKRVHDSNGQPLTSATCINSICELYGDPYSSASDWPSGQETLVNPGAAIEGALAAANSTWVYGGDGGYGTDVLHDELSITVDNDSTRSFIAKIVNARSAELRTRFTQTDGRITGRTIYIYGTPLMEDPLATPKHRFTYEKNLPSVTREVLSDEVYTAVRGIGAQITSDDSETDSDSEEETTPEYLTCEVRANNDILNAWGRPGADNTKKHVWTYYQDSNCDDLEYLSAECAYYLDSVCTPKVQYTCDITDMGNCDIGDYVDVIDKGFNPPVRMRARITEIRKNLLDTVHSGTITIGPPNYPMLEAYVKQEKAAESDSQSVTARTTTKLSSLDKQINSSSGIKAKVGTLDNQINSKSVTAPGLQMQIDEINDWIDEHGSGGGGTGKFSWWDLETDSFAFFDNAFSGGTQVGPKFGITGKTNGTIGCYAVGNTNPEPTDKTWLEGDEVWRALAATDATDSTAKAWLHVPNLAADKIVTSGNPASPHCYIKQHANGIYTGVGLYYSGVGADGLPFIALEPTTNTGAYGFTLKTPIHTSSGTSAGLKGQPVIETYSASSTSYLRLSTPSRQSLKDSTDTIPATCVTLKSSKGTINSQPYQSGSFEVRAGYYPHRSIARSTGGRATFFTVVPGSYSAGGAYNDGYIAIYNIDQGSASSGWKITTQGQILFNNRVILDATTS